MDKIKINSLELENVKRIKAVQLEPSEKGLQSSVVIMHKERHQYLMQSLGH